MNNNVRNFEIVKEIKNWENEYLNNFVENAEKALPDKNNPDTMVKRLYFALSYFQGAIQFFLVMLAMENTTHTKEIERMRKYLINCLEGIIQTLKGV